MKCWIFLYILTGFHLNSTCPGPRKHALKKFFKILTTQNWKRSAFIKFFRLFGGSHDIIVIIDVIKQKEMIDRANIGPGWRRRGAIFINEQLKLASSELYNRISSNFLDFLEIKSKLKVKLILNVRSEREKWPF